MFLMVLLYIVIFLAQAFIFGFMCQALHLKKGHTGGFWMGFFLSVIGLLYSVGLPDLSEKKIVVQNDEKTIVGVEKTLFAKKDKQK